MDAQGVITGLLLGLGGGSGLWKWYLNYRIRNQKKAFLREMLSDERWEWRTIESLQKRIRETPQATRDLLIEIGAHASTGEKEVWSLAQK